MSDVDGAKGPDVREPGAEVATRSVFRRALPFLLIVVCLAATAAAVFSFSKSFQPPGGGSGDAAASTCAMGDPESCAAGAAVGACPSGMATIPSYAEPGALDVEAEATDEELADCIEACTKDLGDPRDSEPDFGAEDVEVSV